MGKYFNPKRGPVTVSLRTGESAIVGPKKVLRVSPEQDGSAMLHAMVRRKLLIRLPDDVVAENVVGEVVKSVEPQISKSVDSTELKEELPSMKWSKKRLKEYAECKGLEILPGSVKLEILRVIESAS